MSLRPLGWLPLLAVLASVATAAVPVPTVMGPISGKAFVRSTSIDLAALGYVEEEFFLSGTATAFAFTTPVEELDSDGPWTVVPSRTAPYQTRILVRRPADPGRFNGTVVVEWLNVSDVCDTDLDWIFAHTHLMREGYAWVGVSAQQCGIDGIDGVGDELCQLREPYCYLQAVNPARYGSLNHPGDSFAYDMFSQAAQAIRAASGVVLAGLTPQRLIAIGQSLSAHFLTTYVNAVHPLAHLYNGYLLHSRFAPSWPLSGKFLDWLTMPNPTFVRGDLDVPVLTLETETDLFFPFFPPFGFLSARQGDTRLFRLWEVAGAAHADLYGLLLGLTDPGPGALDTAYSTATPPPLDLACATSTPINQGPQHYVVSAAVEQLKRWIESGRPPRRALRLWVQGNAFRLDRQGNVLRGVRTPQVDVPIAKLSGLGQTGSLPCTTLGTTEPFDAATLAALYPTHARYMAAVERAAGKAVRRGFVLPADASAIVAAAAASDVGN